jgi:hypothetical protein
MLGILRVNGLESQIIHGFGSKKPPLQKLKEIIIHGFGSNVRKKNTTTEAEGNNNSRLWEQCT